MAVKELVNPNINLKIVLELTPSEKSIKDIQVYLDYMIVARNVHDFVEVVAAFEMFTKNAFAPNVLYGNRFAMIKDKATDLYVLKIFSPYVNSDKSDDLKIKDKKKFILVNKHTAFTALQYFLPIRNKYFSVEGLFEYKETEA